MSSFGRRSHLGAFVTKPLSIYLLARTWAVVAANSMVEELQVAQVRTHTLYQRKANVQYRFVLPYLTS
jgi:hypothetical protein